MGFYQQGHFHPHQNSLWSKQRAVDLLSPSAVYFLGALGASGKQNEPQLRNNRYLNDIPPLVRVHIYWVDILCPKV